MVASCRALPSRIRLRHRGSVECAMPKRRLEYATISPPQTPEEKSLPPIQQSAAGYSASGLRCNFLKEAALRARIYACPRRHADRFANRRSPSRSAATETLTRPPRPRETRKVSLAAGRLITTYRCLAPKLPMITHSRSLSTAVPADVNPTVQLPATSRSELSLRGP